MALKPHNDPKTFIKVLLAIGLKLFRKDIVSNEDILNESDMFVEDLEVRYGKINP